jgi:hypothetical protein
MAHRAEKFNPLVRGLVNAGAFSLASGEKFPQNFRARA